MTVRKVSRGAKLVLAVTTFLSFAWMVAWAEYWLPKERPILVMMAFFVLAGTAMSAGIVAAACAITDRTAAAFAAGYQTGVASVWPDDAETLPPAVGDPILQLVPQPVPDHMQN